jgi:hypothetical protein
MSASDTSRWLGAALAVGIAYLVIGLATASLAGAAASAQGRTGWRLAAWVISAVVFAGHVAYERLRLRTPAASASFHAALAVALGAFGLAAAATVHAAAGAGADRRYGLALILWPLATAVPAFAAAVVLSLALTWRSSER